AAHHEPGQRAAEARARLDRRDDVERSQYDELVARRERDAREDLERLDPEHRERNPGDDRHILRDLFALRPEIVPLEVLLGSLDLSVEAPQDRRDVPAREALERRPEALAGLALFAPLAAPAPHSAPGAAAHEHEDGVDRRGDDLRHAQLVEAARDRALI